MYILLHCFTYLCVRLLDGFLFAKDLLSGLGDDAELNLAGEGGREGPGHQLQQDTDMLFVRSVLAGRVEAELPLQVHAVGRHAELVRFDVFAVRHSADLSAQATNLYYKIRNN